MSEPVRLLSVAPSPAFWVATIAYTAAAISLFVVLAGHAKLRPLALGLVALAFVAHGTDIGWRGTQHVHPAESVREALRTAGIPYERVWTASVFAIEDYPEMMARLKALEERQKR